MQVSILKFYQNFHNTFFFPNTRKFTHAFQSKATQKSTMNTTKQNINKIKIQIEEDERTNNT